MGRLTKQSLLIAVVGVAAVAIPILFMAWKNAVDTNRQQQGTDAEPFRIAGNFYYVGTPSHSVFLITGPEGHVLLDSGYPPGTIASIAKLGFNIKDVKVLITSEPHEGAEGMAELQQASPGARLWASDASAVVIAAGGADPDFTQPLRTLSRLGAMRYPPARVDHRLKDGEIVRVGSLALTAHITAGVSRGCTSWSFPVRDGDRVLNVVSACELTRAGGMRYPEQEADLERSFRVLRSLPVDIWVTGQSRGWGRYRKFAESGTSKDPVKPFIDRGGYLAYIDAAEGDLRNGIVH